MKTNRSLILTGILLLLANAVFSQAICGFDAVHNRRLQKDPAYHQNVLDGEAAIRTYIRQHPQLGQPRRPIVQGQGAPGGPATVLSAPYTIPVVVHVIHTGGAVGTLYNPTDAQILGAIDYLNAVYNGTEANLSGGVGDLQIQFAIAKRDPNCNATNGINRVDGSGVPGYVTGGVNAQTSGGADEVSVKDLSRWNTSQYYNIWVVDKIDGNDGTSGQYIAGFAYFPGAGASVDGIIMLATQMVSGQKTLPHEIGHAFNLYHPFQGSSDAAVCPANTNNNCNLDGDQVCDTDPISENISGGSLNGTCRIGTNPCTNTPYSVNTENNYMNYSFCHTLFTAGQKARMLAAAAAAPRSTLTASLGATAPNAGGSPCGPKINFELTGDQVTESTAATTSCRTYKDYTYNMVIGTGPSAAATATINVGAGNAVRGLDYDLTTNGSFTAPSNTINFPAGNAAAQSFTIRVYDDASINGTRNFVLSFTVNNGGGNAVAGTGRPNFTMLINDNDVAPTPGVSPTGSAIVGPASWGQTLAPFDAKQSAQRSQFLYTASELTAAGIPAGPLSGLSLQVNIKNSSRPFTNFNIKVGTAAVSYLVTGGVLTVGSSMTVVKSLASYSTIAGWNNFTFDTPFTWDGTSNVVVEICYDNGSTAPSDAADQMVYYTDGGTGQGNSIFQNSINCSQAFTSVTYINSGTIGTKPRITFTYGIVTTPVESVVNSSIQKYLGPNADLYFYDQSNNQLIARIQNLTTFDYGCTQVLVDRAGTNSTAFWNNTTANYLMNKTIKVIPTTNNTSGSYNITLYYTPAEVSGWQTATGQSISNIRLVKVGTQISDVTPGSPTAGGAVVIGSPTIGTMGLNTTLTYNFTTGFSGFGAGIPGLSTLPLGLLDFTGQQQHNMAVLNWSTTYETGTLRFGVERSFDGSHFDNIGYVDAAGTSSTQHSYSFTDPLLAEGSNFYRLRQIDQDNKFTYSKTVVLNNNDPNNGLTVMPSPFTNSIDILFGHTPTGKVKVRLLDLTGHQLLRQDHTVTGSDRIHLDCSGLHLSAGIYLLEVNTGNTTRILKVLKN